MGIGHFIILLKNRSNYDMKKYYLIKMIYKEKIFYVIWYENDKDGFMVKGQKIALFDSIENAKTFSGKEKILLENEIVPYDFTNVIDVAEHISDSEDCRMLFKTWNFFSDWAKTLNEEFIGDFDQEQILEIYDKLFYGCNLSVINEGEEQYYPSFDDDEKGELILILKDGFSILEKQLIDFTEMG